MDLYGWKRAVKDTELTSSCKLVLHNLLVYTDEKGACYPSIAQQAKDCGLSIRTVITAISQAVAYGILSKAKTVGEGQSWARNEYQFCLPKGEKKVVQPLHPCANNDIKVVQPLHMNYPEELTNKITEADESGEDPEHVCFVGEVMRIKVRDWKKLEKQFDVTQEQLFPILSERDDFLATLPLTDNRRARWWFPTLKWLEKQVEGLRKSEA